MNGVNNDWLPVEAEAHQSWPPKKIKRKTNTKTDSQTLNVLYISLMFQKSEEKIQVVCH